MILHLKIGLKNFLFRGTTKSAVGAFKKMSFGTCPRSGQTFAEKFNAHVYESLPTPSAVTSEVQFRRAMQIEKDDCADCARECRKPHRYLFVKINDCDNRGGFFACPGAVKDCVFHCDAHPGTFRWFVIDPTLRDEVLFLHTQMADFWECISDDCDRKQWWFKALNAHADIKALQATPYRWLESDDETI